MQQNLPDPAHGPGNLHAHERALIAEIQLLFDYAGGNANQSISDLKVPRIVETAPAGGTGRPRDDFFTTQECLEQLHLVEGKLCAGADFNGTDQAFLHLLRDGLNALVKPATGMTIAYTTMATTGEGKGRAPRLHLSEKAYPALASIARCHRLFSYIFLAIAVLATGFAVWEATKVALGKSLLASLQDLRTQQQTLNTDKMRLEAKSDNAKEWDAPTFPSRDGHSYSLRACDNASFRYYGLSKVDRAKLQEWAKHRQAIEGIKSAQANKPTPEDYEILVFESPAEQDICDRDLILASRFGLFYHGLQSYRTNWPSLVSRSFEVAEAAADLPQLLYQFARQLFGPADGKEAQSAVAEAVTGDDYEWIVVARLVVMGNYVLPVVFSFLGAISFVMVDYFTKVRGGLLAPRDLPLAGVRLVLGLLVGACIGLIYSSGAPVAQAPTATPTVGALVSALSLSASGIAFLAGFGVDAVFSMLESLVRRVFPTTT
jgi:hypothetical protein